MPGGRRARLERTPRSLQEPDLRHPPALWRASPGRRRYLPGGLLGPVQRTAPLARRRSPTGLAGPRDHPQVLPLETPARYTQWRARRGPPRNPGRRRPHPGRPDGRDRARADRAGSHRATPPPLPRNDRAPVLRYSADAVRRSGAAPESGQRLDRLHPWALPQAPEKAPRTEGLLIRMPETVNTLMAEVG